MDINDCKIGDYVKTEYPFLTYGIILDMDPCDNAEDLIKIKIQNQFVWINVEFCNTITEEEIVLWKLEN